MRALRYLHAVGLRGALGELGLALGLEFRKDALKILCCEGLEKVVHGASLLLVEPDLLEGLE